VNRIRLLNDEKRKFTTRLAEKESLPFTDNARYMSIRKQTDELVVRSRMLRNAIFTMQIAVGLFVVTSIAIGLNLFVSAELFRALPLVVFMAGMLCVLVGIVYAGVEIRRSFKIVLIEVKAEE
jgi:1,4-dihydroxy-2-naphthoate octaprenyltransferase